MKEVHLVPRTTCRDIEPPLRRLISQRWDVTAPVWRGNHAEEHHAALVTLEGIGVTAYKLAALHLLWPNLA